VLKISLTVSTEGSIISAIDFRENALVIGGNKAMDDPKRFGLPALPNEQKGRFECSAKPWIL
jgi:hypothetical protein